MERFELTDTTLGTLLGVTPRTVKSWRLDQRPLLGPAARLLWLLERYPSMLKELSQLDYLPLDIRTQGDHI